MRGRAGDRSCGSRAARCLFVLGSLLPILAFGTAGTATAAPNTATGAVVLVGVPGLTWADVSHDGTPALWSLLEDGAAGTLVTRSVYAAACPADGWLAVSAGRRAADAPGEDGERCRTLPDPIGGQLGRWPIYLDEAGSSSYAAHPGVLGDLLAEQKVRATAIGPGAAIALATSTGRVAGEYAPRPVVDATLADLVRVGVASSDLVVVDAGELIDRATGNPDRSAQAGVLDDRVAAVLEAAGPRATVVVAALADSGPTPRLDLLAARGSLDGNVAAGLITTSSTRQPGIAQAVDLTPTLVELLGLPTPSDLVGTPLRTQSEEATAGTTLARLLDLEAASAAARPVVAWIFNGLVVVHLLYVVMVALLALSRRRAPDREWPFWLAIVSTGLAAVPVASFLAHLLPWWRWGGPTAYLGTMFLIAAAVVAVTFARSWRRHPLIPMAVVGGLTAAVLGGDVLTGSRLTLAAPMGLQPLVGGRFYGLGNVQFALFAVGCMLLAIAVADSAVRAGRRKLGATAVAAIGLFGVVVDGTPGLGSDFGGPPSIVPMFVLFALIVAGVELRPGRVQIVFAGAALLVVAIAVADWLRPLADRTHLGRFVASVLDGEVGGILLRKLSQNLANLVGSPLTLLALGSVLLVGFVLFGRARWGGGALRPVLVRAPVLAPGVGCLFVGLAIGTAVNDSGTVVLAMGMCLVVPLLVAARCARDSVVANGRSEGSAAAGSRTEQLAQPEVEETTSS